MPTDPLPPLLEDPTGLPDGDTAEVSRGAPPAAPGGGPRGSRWRWVVVAVVALVVATLLFGR